MKTSERKTFEGAGYLIGFIISALTAIPAFVITENFVVSIFSIPIGVTMGIVLEQQFQGHRIKVSKRIKAWLLVLLLLGIIAFITLLAIVNF